MSNHEKEKNEKWFRIKDMISFKNDSYRVVKPRLGKGAFGLVHEVEDTKDEARYALKVVDLRTSNSSLLENEKNMWNEVMGHPNILYLKECFRDTETEVMGFVSSKAHGDLFDIIFFKPFEEELARTYFHQMVDVIEYCHKMGIYHRDLKLQNFLIGDGFKLLLADFGLAKKLKVNEYTEERCGTESYMAPEIYRGYPYRGGPADIWSLGVMLFIELFGAHPFNVASSNSDPLFKMCQELNYSSFWTVHQHYAKHMANCDEAKDLLQLMFVTDPNYRITIEDIKQHSWYKGRVLSDNDLEHVMHVQYLHIQKEDMREAATTAAEIMVNKNKRNRSMSHDREDRAKIQRSTIEQDSVLPPEYIGSTLAPNKFFSYGAEDILSRLSKHILEINSAAHIVTNTTEYNLKVSLQLCCDDLIVSQQPLDLNVQVYQAPNENGDTEKGLLLVTVEMTSENIRDYHVFLRSLRRSLFEECKIAEEIIANEKRVIERFDRIVKLGGKFDFDMVMELPGARCTSGD